MNRAALWTSHPEYGKVEEVTVLSRDRRLKDGGPVLGIAGLTYSRQGM